MANAIAMPIPDGTERRSAFRKFMHSVCAVTGPYDEEPTAIHGKLLATGSSPVQWVPVSEIEPGIFLGGIAEPKDDGFKFTVDPYRDASYQEVKMTRRPLLNLNVYNAPHAIIKDHNISSLLSFTDLAVIWNITHHSHNVKLDAEGVVVDYYPGTIVAPKVSVYRHHYFPDHAASPLWIHFEDFHQQISNAKKEGKNFFVHCRAGVSRSVTALAAYYIKEGIAPGIWSEIPDGISKPTVEQVLLFIKSKRSFICPNVGFILQLICYRTWLRSLDS